MTDTSSELQSIGLRNTGPIHSNLSAAQLTEALSPVGRRNGV